MTWCSQFQGKSQNNRINYLNCDIFVVKHGNILFSDIQEEQTETARCEKLAQAILL